MVPASRDSEKHSCLTVRISSYTPRLVGAAVALITGLRHWPVSGSVSWVLLTLGAVDFAASAICLVAWKQVREGKYYYYCSDLFRSEAIHRDDVRFVEGVMWLFAWTGMRTVREQLLDRKLNAGR